MTDERERLSWREDISSCFGCSPTNERGLHLEFFKVGERAVECRFTPAPELNGAPGIVHGGVQATIVDEAMGYACHVGGDEFDVVTIDLQLRFRRPLPTGELLVCRAEVVDHDERDLHARAQLSSEAGEVRTEATARFRIVPR